MLQEHHRISAPNASSVSINTAVCTVKCRDPVILAPFNGFLAPISCLHAINPGISISDNLMSLRPYSACFMSRTLYTPFTSSKDSSFFSSAIVSQCTDSQIRLDSIRFVDEKDLILVQIL